MIRISNKYTADERSRYYNFVVNQRPRALAPGGNGDKIVDFINKLPRKDGYEVDEIKSFNDLLTMNFARIQGIIESLNIGNDAFDAKMEDNHALLNSYKNYYSNFFGDLDKEIGEKNNISLIRNLGVNVCPYCNRNYINSRSGRLGANFDHFYPKEDYPFFALSLYNLVPSCNTCNIIKGTDNFYFCPFDENSGETMNFKVSPDGEINIEHQVDERDEFENNIVDVLRLEDAYQFHSLDVKEMFSTEEEYCKEYRNKLSELLEKNTSGIDTSQKYFDYMIYGKIADDDFDDYLNNSLSKLRKDNYNYIVELRN